MDDGWMDEGGMERIWRIFSLFSHLFFSVFLSFRLSSLLLLPLSACRTALRTRRNASVIGQEKVVLQGKVERMGICSRSVMTTIKSDQSIMDGRCERGWADAGHQR